MPNKGYSLLDEGCGDFLFFFVPVPDITQMWAKVADLYVEDALSYSMTHCIELQHFKPVSALQCKVLMSAMMGKYFIIRMAYSCFAKLNQHSTHPTRHMH